MAKSLLRTNNEIVEIYQRQVTTIYRVCRVYLKNTADAEDAVADTFVKMIQSSPAFENETHEKAWLIRTAINVCKDVLKHWWGRREALNDNMKTKERTEIDETLEVVCSLHEKYKAVVLLYYYDGYTTGEIAGILHKPAATIRVLLFQARKILKAKLGGDFA